MDTDEILRKYKSKIENQLNSFNKEESSDYTKFKSENYKQLTNYEKWVKILGHVIKIKLSPKENSKIQTQINYAHINATPSEVVSLSVISFLLIFFAVLIAAVSIYLINNTVQVLFVFLGLLAAVFVFYYTYSLPQKLANTWRLKASSQMVPAILYIVVYMKHTSNLERAIEFAAKNLEAPLALDLKKIFYDVEIGKFTTIKQSLENYLSTWREYAPEFIESFHLIESSLYESSDSRRIQTLERALQVILDGVYEKMLRFSREIRSPITNVYMLGIVLPTLAISLLPLASTLLGGLIQWHHLFILFNFIIPFMVYYMTSEILLKRPGGYGEASNVELNPEYHKFISNKYWLPAIVLALPLILIALIPFIFQIDFLTTAFNLNQDYTFQELKIPFLENLKLFDFKVLDGQSIGPFGVPSVILSLFIPLGIAFLFSTVYKAKTKDLIKSRNETKQLEIEFTNTLFQLGNRLGDGIPAEIAFAKVGENTQGQRTQNFFSIVNQNVQQLGMSITEAIFNPNRGALLYYPSSLIATSMRILTESVKKGLQVAARSLISISEYVKNIQKINERLRDLLAEIISDMKSNMVFLAPLLAGVIVGLSTMITLILNTLQTLTETGFGGQQIAGFSVINITNFFNVSSMIPPYFLQISIGLYIIQVIFILTGTLVTIDAGKDVLKEKYELAKNLNRGVFLYVLTSLIAIVSLTILASISLQGIIS